jgi:non-ribosomal peptide synthetase component F
LAHSESRRHVRARRDGLADRRFIATADLAVAAAENVAKKSRQLKDDIFRSDLERIAAAARKVALETRDAINRWR